MAEKKLFCNGCGRILKYENDILREDVFEGLVPEILIEDIKSKFIKK